MCSPTPPPPACDLVVTRRHHLVTALREQGVTAPHRTNIKARDIAGKVVMGSLPYDLAQYAAQVIVVGPASEDDAGNWSLEALRRGLHYRAYIVRPVHAEVTCP